MTEDEAEDAITRREAWALDKARRILTGWAVNRDDLAGAADITLGVNATTVTVHPGGREVANFGLLPHDLERRRPGVLEATHIVPPKPRPKLRLVLGSKGN